MDLPQWPSSPLDHAFIPHGLTYLPWDKTSVPGGLDFGRKARRLSHSYLCDLEKNIIDVFCSKSQFSHLLKKKKKKKREACLPPMTQN